MAETAPRVRDPNRVLRRVQRGVLATLAACALGTATAVPPHPGGLGTLDRRYTLAALALGIASILARRQASAPRVEPRPALRWALAAALSAGAIGLLGLFLALARGERNAALLYMAGAAILALRRPSLPAGPPVPREIESP